MTTIIETLDGGEIETGFWGPDVSKIQLGELPLMTTQQFVGYAALTLSEQIIPRLDPAQRDEWARDMHPMREQVEKIPTFAVKGKFFGQNVQELLAQVDDVAEEDREELMSTLSAAAVPTDDAVYYRENPFKVRGDGQRVGFVDEDGEIKHVIAAEDFFNLAFNIIRGGIMGWGRATYPEIKQAAATIATTLEQYGSPAVPPENIQSGTKTAQQAENTSGGDDISTIIKKIIDDTL